MVNVTFSMFDFNLWCVLGILKLVPFHYKNHHKINLHLASIFVLKACHFAEWIWQFYFLHSFKMIQSYFCVCFSSCWLIFLIRKYTHLAEVMWNGFISTYQPTVPIGFCIHFNCYFRTMTRFQEECRIRFKRVAQQKNPLNPSV